MNIKLIVFSTIACLLSLGSVEAPGQTTAPFKLLKSGKIVNCHPDIEAENPAVPKDALVLVDNYAPDEMALKIGDEAARVVGPALSVEILCFGYEPIEINFGPLQVQKQITLPMREISLKARDTVHIIGILQQKLQETDKFSADVLIRNDDSKTITTEEILFRLQHGKVGICLSAIDKVEEVELIVAGGEEKGHRPPCLVKTFHRG